ncbi:MAG: response regulator [Proteobacteria bacterium]|nr:response regulator [Pseudomonadota bacterium]
MDERKTILIVDDHEDDRVMLKQLFESVGYKTLLSNNGEDAQSILLTQKIDLVFSDMLMPIMDGLQLCKMIKNNPNLSHIYVVLYSSIYSENEDKTEAIAVGADKYIVKPKEPEQILLEVGETLGLPIQAIKNSKVEINKEVKDREGYLELYNTQLVQRLEQEVSNLREEITKREALEQVLQENQYNLVKAQQIGKIGHWKLTIDSNALESSDELLSIYNLDKYELSLSKLLDCIHPSDREAQAENIEQAIQQNIGWESEYRLLLGGGEIKWVSSVGEPMLDSSWQLMHLLVIVQDITIRKNTDENLWRSQKMDAMGKLSGGIAHDYNNMLGVILGYAALLKEAVEDQPKLLKYVNYIENASQRSVKLTQKLLGFTRKKTTQLIRVDLNDLVLNEQDMLEKTLTARIKLILGLGDDLWPVYIDSGDWEDVIVNLTINAMHAIEGQGKVNIETSNVSINDIESRVMLLESGDYVLFSITDSGCGIDRNVISKIFDPFFSTKGDRGTGLGLSQVYGFVDRSGGCIKVYSEIDKGTKISLYFPRYEGAKEQGEKKEDSMQVMTEMGSEVILVVDDEASLLDLASDILTASGYQVICVTSAEEALKVIKKQKIDLLFSDVIMPEMSGYELASIVSEVHPNIKIQLTSGFHDEGDSQFDNEVLRSNLLSKPYHTNILLKKVRLLLDKL